MPVNSGVKAIQITGKKKTFYRQRLPVSGCPGKETIDINILVTSRNGDRKVVQFMHNEQTSHEKKGVEPVQPFQMIIYQSNTTGDFSWLHFNDEPGV